eukprot:g39988.t1
MASCSGPSTTEAVASRHSCSKENLDCSDATTSTTLVQDTINKKRDVYVLDLSKEFTVGAKKIPSGTGADHIHFAATQCRPHALFSHLPVPLLLALQQIPRPKKCVWAMEVKSKSKLIGEQKAGEVIISRSTGTPPHSPKLPLLDLTLPPSPKKAKPAPKFPTKLGGGRSLLADKAAEAMNSPLKHELPIPTTFANPSPSKTSKSLSLTLDDDAYDSTPPLPNLGDAVKPGFSLEGGGKTLNPAQHKKLAMFDKNGGELHLGTFPRSP